LCLAGIAVAEVPDTARLRAALRDIRGRLWVEYVDFDDVQSIYLEWIDARAARGESIDNMNAELKSAGLLAGEGDLLQNNVGKLDEIEIRNIENDPFASRNRASVQGRILRARPYRAFLSRRSAGESGSHRGGR
jgi:hypothetical protein